MPWRGPDWQRRAGAEPRGHCQPEHGRTDFGDGAEGRRPHARVSQSARARTARPDPITVIDWSSDVCSSDLPSLVGIANRNTAEQISATGQRGGGRMPGFPNLRAPALRALVQYVMTGASQTTLAADAPSPLDMKYRFTGYKRFLDPDGYPATAPPWGTLNAINLNTGEYAWRIPLGEYPELAAKGMRSEEHTS